MNYDKYLEPNLFEGDYSLQEFSDQEPNTRPELGSLHLDFLEMPHSKANCNVRKMYSHILA